MRNVSSFSISVKEEIVSRDYSKERLLAILSSFTRGNGSLLIKNKKEHIVLRIENSKIAKFIYNSIIKLFNKKPTISYLRKTNLKKNTCYLLTIEDSKYLDKLHIDYLSDSISNVFSKDNEVIGGYLAGAFLSNGSVNSPRSSNYHLEVSFSSLDLATSFIKLMHKYKNTNFVAKSIKRRDKYIVYIKRSDQIVDFLVLIGATDACLYFENVRVDRDFDNINNRINNITTANYQKTMNTSNKDIKIINRLIKKKGLTNLGSEKVVTLASLRVKYPEDSLEALSKRLSTELKMNISKSNVNHILRALREEGRNL